MKNIGRKRPVPLILLLSAFILFCFLILQPFQVFHFREDIAFLFPSGWIAVEERNQLLIIQAIMLLVIIPVYILTFIFSWRYRASKQKCDL